MISIFTTEKGLFDITHRSEFPWNNLIRKQKIVYTDKPIDIPRNPKDPIFILKQAQVKFDYSRAGYIKSLIKNPSNFLKEPCGIFILDIEEDKAKKFQKEYGVLALPLSNPSLKLLSQRHPDAELIINKRGKSWGNILKSITSYPVNSIVIIDAYLFEDDKYKDENHDLGKCNLYQILDKLLPTTFEGVFNIGIFLDNYDQSRISKNRPVKTNLTNQQIVKAIGNIKKDLNRIYTLNCEVYFLSREEGFHSLIHNRRIFTNTFYLSMLHKLACIKKDNETARVNDTVVVKSLFEGIEDIENDPKAKRLESELNDFNEYIRIMSNKEDSIDEVYQNGKKLNSFKNVEHRFINREMIKEMKTKFLQILKKRLEDQGQTIVANKIYSLMSNLDENWITISLGNLPYSDNRGTFGLEGILAGKGTKENPFRFDLYISTWLKCNSDDYSEKREKEDLEYLKKLFPNLNFEYPHKARFKSKLSDYKWIIDQEEETTTQIVSDWLKWQGEIEVIIKKKAESQTDNGEEEK